MSIRVIAGLGNPGKKYALTRHNLGFMVVEELAKKHGMSFKEEKEFSAKVAKGILGDQQIHLLMPTTYMNESGRAIRRCLDFYKATPEELVVVADDVSIPYGEIRLRHMGSAGGHNGLKNTELHLGTQHYPRLRMGIGRPSIEGQPLADYVLGNFTPEELDSLTDFVQRGVNILERLTRENITHVMGDSNTRKAVG